MKTGCHPMRTRLRLFLDWGITFEDPFTVPERADREVAYASFQELQKAILDVYPPPPRQQKAKGKDAPLQDKTLPDKSETTPDKSEAPKSATDPPPKDEFLKL